MMISIYYNQINLYDLKSNSLVRKSLNTNSNYLVVKIDISEFVSGTYIYSFVSQNKNQAGGTIQIVK